jgi:hypothetical protein
MKENNIIWRIDSNRWKQAQKFGNMKIV